MNRFPCYIEKENHNDIDVSSMFIFPSILNTSCWIPPTVTPLLDTDSTLPSFEDICKLQCNTIRQIPAKSRPAFMLILSATLRSALNANDEMSWLKLFLLPKCVLVSSKHRGRHHTPMSIGHLCNLWSQGQFDTLWEHATRQATPRDRHLGSATQDKVLLLTYPLPCMVKLAKRSPPQGLPPTRILRGNCCGPNTLRELLLLTIN